MAILVDLDVMLALRKMRLKTLAEHVGITEQNMSLLKSGKVKGIRFETLEKICATLDCQPGDLLEFRRDKQDETMSAALSLRKLRS
ncbi:helix-turn-helix transcriptional regulator [Martelella alba]|uniref:Helix-turn-helix transcriptional regulator n=1 Tax=Martelella alba TaxID=2590451 RepID=A0A506U9Z1_9HYPH|nr:helix-turn-helix transcriptional regulator [Martelella alba]TPW29765.1 helix-turn-helix transcriptional regulator [Martelella alba]